MKIAPISWYKKLLCMAYPAYRSVGSGGADMGKNGELSLLEWMIAQQTSRKDRFICFDVGANVGDYSNAILRSCGKNFVECEVHAFEPSAKSFEKLANIKGDGQHMFIANNFALSDVEGKSVIYFDKPGSSLASIYKRDIGIPFEGKEEITAKTGKSYIEERRIPLVSLMKIDVEGHELKVLKGLGDALDPNRIQFIQFEYGGSYKDSNTTLEQAYELLTGKGYAVGRLLKNSVEVRSYDKSMEDFAYSNFVALDPKFIKSGILRKIK
jgi:FkbM family methyltransferase